MFQLDSEVSVNVLSGKHVNERNRTPAADKTIVMRKGAEINTQRESRLKLINPNNGKKYAVKLVIVRDDLHPHLGTTAMKNRPGPREQRGVLGVSREVPQEKNQQKKNGCKFIPHQHRWRAVPAKLDRLEGNSRGTPKSIRAVTTRPSSRRQHRQYFGKAAQRKKFDAPPTINSDNGWSPKTP